MSVTVAHGAAHAPGDSGGDGSAPSGGSLRAHAACLRPGRRLPPPFLPPMFSQLFSSCRLSLGCFFGSPSACLARGAQQDRSCLSCGVPWAARPPRPAARALGHLRPLSAEAFGQRLSSPACGFSFPGGAPHADSNGRVVYFSERGVVSLMSPTGGCLQVTVLAGTIPKVAAKKPATFLRLMAHRTCARRAR